MIANQFGEATPGTFLSAVIEAGLIVFIITLITNILARGLISSMQHHGRERSTRMSTTVSERQSSASNPFHPPQSARGIQRQFSNGCLIVLATVFALLAVGVLIYLLLYVILNGIRYINLDFFTNLPTPNGEPGGGMGPAIQGTIILVGLASLFGIPLGIFTAIYLSEFGRGRLANVVRSLVDLLTGVPTIIFGLFAWVLIVVPQQTFSGFAGGVALGYHHDPDRRTHHRGCAAPGAQGTA